jgi:peptidoglycan/LPS O-acetylase OafA/YrhL
VEEQFYLVFPWLFVPWLRGKPALSISMFSIALVASVACSIWLGKVDETRAFYMTWSRFWELGAGVLLFQFPRYLSTLGNSQCAAILPPVGDHQCDEPTDNLSTGIRSPTKAENDGNNSILEK